MPSPQQPGRDARYPLPLPLSVKLAHKEMRPQAEKISLKEPQSPQQSNATVPNPVLHFTPAWYTET